MSQIYNGSFVLGNTSATTLSAGEGIKLDTSVPGVIGISNDETVLWSSTNSTGDAIAEGDHITLSEEISNFETIEIYYVHQTGWGLPCVFKLSTLTSQNRFCLEQIWYREQSGYNNYWQSVSFMKYDSTNRTITVTQVSQRPILTTSWASSTGLNVTLFKVVCINRKQNGGV